MSQSRLFLCGITCGSEIDKIKDLVNKTKDYVDGFCWTIDDNNKTEELFDFLWVNKKEGMITVHPFMQAHDWQANEWLHCGALKEGDWVWMFDSSECPSEYWLKWIRQGIEVNEQNGIIANYCSGRPYLFKFTDSLFFHGTPHWGLYGFVGQAATIKEEEKSQFIINKRDLNPDKHYQEHDTKYYLYGRSNQMQMFYGKYGQKVVNYHDDLRLSFRKHLRIETGLEPSLKALDKLFQKKKENFTSFEVSMIDLEFCLSEYYQRTVLGMNFMGTRPEIQNGMHPRYKWSFKNYLEFGNGWYDKDYKGTIIKYNEGNFPK